MTSTTVSTPSGADPGRLARVGWWLMLALAILASAHSVAFMLGLSTYMGQDGGQHARMFRVPVLGAAHTIGGANAMMVGPFQFLDSLRRRRRRLHVWLGRIYLASVAVGALAALLLSPGSMAADTLGIAFICLALAWLYTGGHAYLAVRRRDFEDHRRWMIRNYALTYAAVTLRIEMPLLMLVFGMSPIRALDVVGWLCWLPNLFVVETFMMGRGTRLAPGRRRAPT
jgi:hypothetical protein